MVLLGQILVNGVLLGGLYGLMALGMGLVWGVLNIVNLAHGALIMLGGYVVYYLYTGAGLDPFLALPVAMAVMFALGWILERYVLALVVRSAMLNTLLVTFGLDVLITYLAQLAFTADLRTINPPYTGESFQLAGVTIPLAPLGGFVVAVVLAAALGLFLSRTRTGRAVRATAQNLTAARLHGIDPRSVYALTFGLGAALAGAAGGLYGIVSQLTPYVGVTLTAKSFVVAILGGLDSPPGVILGGILLGVAEAATALYLDPTYTNVISFGMLVLLLVLRPAQVLERA